MENRRNLRSTIERRSVDVNKKFVGCFADVTGLTPGGQIAGDAAAVAVFGDANARPPGRLRRARGQRGL